MLRREPTRIEMKSEDLEEFDRFQAQQKKAAKAEEVSWESTQKNIVSAGSEFASSKFYRDHITRHTRMDSNPNEKYNQPVTANMEIGWSPPESARPR